MKIEETSPVTIQKIQILRKSEKLETEKMSHKVETPSYKLGKPSIFIIFHSIYEFWIKNRLKTGLLTSQTDRLTNFHP